MGLTADQVLPTKQSAAEEWVAWYKLLPGNKDTRNAVFLTWWKRNGSDKANTPDLRLFLKGEGIMLTTDGLGNLVDSALGAKNTLSSVFSYGLITYGILAVVGLGFTLVLIKTLATPENIATAAKIYTRR